MRITRETWVDVRRLLGIGFYVLLLLALFHKNLMVPETRGIAVLGFAASLSLALGY